MKASVRPSGESAGELAEPAKFVNARYSEGRVAGVERIKKSTPTAATNSVMTAPSATAIGAGSRHALRRSAPGGAADSGTDAGAGSGAPSGSVECASTGA